MQSYCAVRHSKFLYFCNTPYCFLRAKCLTSLTTIILRPALEVRTCRPRKVMPYPGSPAWGWSGEGQAGALAYLQLTAMCTFPAHTVC